MEPGRKLCAERDRVGSTNAAVSDTAQHIFDLSCTKLGVDGGHRCHPTQSTIRSPQPAHDQRVIAQALMGKSHDASKAVKAVRFKAGQASLMAPPLQTSRRKIERLRQLLERQSG